MGRPPRDEFESRLRQFRVGAGLTQDQLAEQLGVTTEMVRKHERGISLPIPLYRQRYAALFHVGENEIWVTTSACPVPAVQTPSESPLVHLAAGDEPLNRAILDSAREEIPKLVAFDNRFGGSDFVGMCYRLFSSLQTQAESRDLTTLGADLYDTLGELAELTGWLAYDSEKHALARRMNQEALYYARLAGDRGLELLALQNTSMHAAAMGRPAEALAVVEGVLRTPLSPRLSALFLMRKARALAQLGDPSALSLFPRIRSDFLEGSSDRDYPKWFWWIDERELAWHEAMALRDLGQRSKGIECFARSVEATPGPELRSQYLHRAYLLQGLVELGSWKDAELTAESLRPLAREVGSTRTDKILQAVSAVVCQRNSPSPSSIQDLVRVLAGAKVGAEMSGWSE